MTSFRMAAVLLVLLACGACSAQRPRTDAADAAPSPSALPPLPARDTPTVAAPDPAPRVLAPPAAPRAVSSMAAPKSFWSRVRGGFRFADCEAPAVARAREAYRRGGERTRSSITRALPLMELVLEALERRDLPTEFLFLPMIESGYAAVPGRGASPAGMWQIVPVTARGLGLVMDARYDARLDAVASTEAAVVLLERLARRFDGDWRLATMAYNAGEFRLARALGGSPPADLRRLALPAVTHAHLARLQGIACHVRDSELPEPDPARALDRIVIETPVELVLAAALAGVPYDAFRRDNPAHRDGTVAAGRTLLVPRAGRDRFEALLAELPSARRTGWRTAPRAAAIATSLVDAALLARINERSGDAAWLVPLPRGGGTEHAIGSTHRIARGDSLWAIARRYGTTVARLRALNGLAERTVLQPGDVLRVAAPRSP